MKKVMRRGRNNAEEAPDARGTSREGGGGRMNQERHE
jgi:hypothetical protein